MREILRFVKGDKMFLLHSFVQGVYGGESLLRRLY